MQLYRLDSSQSPDHGGVLCVFPSGARKQVAWHYKGPIPDTLALAKKCVAHLVDHCLQAGLVDDLERTNLVSAVAGVQAVIQQHNEAARRAQAAIPVLVS